MSNASPLGVKFNNIRTSTMNIEKKRRTGVKAGFACIKGYLRFNTSFTERPICTASTQYMKLRTEEIEKSTMTEAEKAQAFDAMTEKSCLCVGLVTATLRSKNIKAETETVSVCPGPNLAYFNKIVSLREMVDHIYNRTNLIVHPNRPNFLIKEISLYIDHLKGLIDENNKTFTEKNRQYIDNFRNKMLEGLAYYQKLVPELKEESEKVQERFSQALIQFEMQLKGLSLEVVSC